MPRGSKPGERRGGRKKGTPNKTTQERLIRIEEARGNHRIKLGKDVINDIMVEMLLLAQKYHPDTGEEPNEEKFAVYAGMAERYAVDLAPYQSPRLQTLKVGGDQNNPLMIQEGETAETITNTLMEMIRRVRPDPHQAEAHRGWFG